MTRELKLALIIGFALVLAVVVLVTDHFSKASKARLAQGPSDSPVATAPMGGLTPPASTIATAQPGPLGTFVANDMTQPPAGGLPTGGVAATGAKTGGGDAVPVEPGTAPVMTLTQGRKDGSSTTEPSLLDEVRKVGGDIVNGQIVLPPAAQVQQGQLANTASMSNPVGVKTGSAPVASTPAGNGTNVLIRPVSQPTTTLSRGDVARPTGPVPTAAAPAADARTYTVANGDTAIKIARKVYGDGNAWRKLAEANPGVVGKNGELRVGAKLKLPADAKVPSAAPAPGGAPAGSSGSKAVPRDTRVAKSDRPGKIAVTEPKTVVKKPAKTTTYTVRKGDTLGVIAQRTLGSSKRAQDIIDANTSVIDDENSIPVGTVLRIPAKDS